MSNSLRLHGLYSPWNSPDQNTEVGSLSLLQRIFPTQGLNPGLLHCTWILYQLSHQGSPRILEWVAYHFSRESSRLRNWTGSPALQADFFTSWATREALRRLHRWCYHEDLGSYQNTRPYKLWKTVFKSLKEKSDPIRLLFVCSNILEHLPLYVYTIFTGLSGWLSQ